MTYQDYLAHHGILGMRWGKRNGPPYPLNESQMSFVERRKNEESEWASKVRENKRKEKEQVRKAKFREKEQVRKNKVAEKEARRQAKVDEKERARQNRVNEEEASIQNEYQMEEARRQYKQGRKYVRNSLIGLGVMAGLVIVGRKLYLKGEAKREAKEAAKEAASVLKEEIAKERRIANANAAYEAGRRATEAYILSKGVLGLAGIKKH